MNFDSSKVFAGAQPFSRTIKFNLEAPLAPPVLARELYVASVDEKIQIIPSLMALYANTKSYPLIVFT